ncbi:unnamed protein product [Brassica oleracea]
MFLTSKEEEVVVLTFGMASVTDIQVRHIFKARNIQGFLRDAIATRLIGIIQQ